jgi:hypothetical protein
MMALGDLLGDAGIGYFYMYSLCFAPGPTCWGSTPLYVPPLSYKRGGMQRYKGESQTQTQLRLTHSLKLTSSYKLSSSIHHKVE